jgi:hypothetical protein
MDFLLMSLCMLARLSPYWLFWRDWLLIIKNAFVKSAAGEEQPDIRKIYSRQIIIASVPAAIAGL